MTKKLCIWITLAWMSCAAPALAAAEAALITSLNGKVLRLGAENPLEAFVKLKSGDNLMLEKDAQVQITYFENGRQESWRGTGKLTIGTQESLATGLPAAQIKQLPLAIVKQIARTPSLDSQGRAGVMRLRAIPTPEAIAKIEDNYRQMRDAAEKSDLNPEIYLLSGMLEMRQIDRVEQVLADMKQNTVNNPEAKLLVSLYTRALKDIQATAK